MLGPFLCASCPFVQPLLPAIVWGQRAQALGLIPRTPCACVMTHGRCIVVRLLWLCLARIRRRMRCGCILLLVQCACRLLPALDPSPLAGAILAMRMS
jgi:hypothetical protein